MGDGCPFSSTNISTYIFRIILVSIIVFSSSVQYSVQYHKYKNTRTDGHYHYYTDRRTSVVSTALRYSTYEGRAFFISYFLLFTFSCNYCIIVRNHYLDFFFFCHSLASLSTNHDMN